MIYRLQRKFILVSAAAVFAVILLVFGIMTVLNISSMNRALDALADAVSWGGGKFPPSFENRNPQESKPTQRPGRDFITPETRFATRYFTVWFDADGAVFRTETESIYSVTEDEAIELAEKVVGGNTRGWIAHYRYKVFPAEEGDAVVFIDGSVNRASLFQSVLISAGVLLGCAVVVLLLTVIFSKRVMKPVAESYEKQKQFITDANHELKTPLTLILTNLDIAEAELGHNEWLADIRQEGQRMAGLVNQLVALSRMDEEERRPDFSELNISDIVSDTVSEFAALSEERGKHLTADIDSGIHCTGDEALLRRLVSVLMDNAVKYCDENGRITVTLKRGRTAVLTVENSYRAVDGVELHRLFDRFYRADKARTFTGGYGIGLSIAKAIVQKHRGEISAYKKDGGYIGFKVILKNA